MANVNIGFALNYQYANLIDTTPNGSDHTWAFLGQGINEITSENEDKIDEQDDYSTGGNTVTTVTGVKNTVSVSGTRVIGDAAQDYIASLQEVVGPERETYYRIVSPTGEIVQEKITVKDINFNGPSGSSSDKQAVSCTFARNDTPEIIKEPVGMHLPSSVTLDAVSVEVGESEQVTPTVTPTTASAWCLYSTEDTDIAKVTGDGKVIGIKAGKTRLCARCAAKPAVRVTVDVTVTAAA